MDTNEIDVNELLRLEAEDLEREMEADDPQAFVRRLEERLAAGGRAAAHRAVRRSGKPAAAARPAAAPRVAGTRPHPAEAAGPGGTSSAGPLEALEQLCAVVMAGASPGQIDSFFAGGRDVSGATVAACLLYGLGSPGAADSLWRVADGAEEPLAAHFLLLYYTATDQKLLARLYRERPQVIVPQQLPELPLTPVGSPTELAQELTTQLDPPTIGTLTSMTTHLDSPAIATLTSMTTTPSPPATTARPGPTGTAPPSPQQSAPAVRLVRTINGTSRRKRRQGVCPPPQLR